MILQMFVDILKFLVIFGISFLVFTSVGMIMFRTLDEFKNIQNASIYLFSSSLGGFDFTVMENLTTIKPIYGYIYITVFLLVMMITLLNFVIALMSDTYAILSAIRDGIFLQEIIVLR